MTLFRLLPLTLAMALCLSALPAGRAAAASDLTRYKDLRNDYVKVTDIKERDRTEEQYVESGGKVTLQKIPYKEVMVTAELIQKPPTSMDTMFSGAEPLFKVCMSRFDAADKPLEDDCQSLRFQSMVKGNVGTASFRLPQDTARYEFRVAQKQGDKGSTIKLWTPVN
ncbi:hypothetical protein DFW101_2370 [Solidesulfovibrio carbinoliphilus subsp. oakridgensis]|uniref:Uncharacterized protein n=1 Tax=Solidesulfovibrio carbinoliphilus subsp. oakridgensis TaxID=694327 RepID=G7Q551_9BACT|nr:hypothetical protein [Solidesulfovibrio carbinoliphilus]EHJ48374.1 hypothetical protein DFW101_2370 [Solidesulfovibrio carbinoliphilus subsp. oakridgensis]